MSVCLPTPDEEQAEPLTVARAREMGFGDEEIDSLRQAGLLREDELGEPWRPRTMDDVSWIVLQLRLLETEERTLREQLKRRLKRIEDRERWLTGYFSDCREITLAELPRNARTGKPARKYLDLEDGRVGIRTAPGGPRIVDEALVIDAIKRLKSLHALPEGLAAAVRVTQQFEGAEAIQRLDAAAQVKILSAPVKAFVESLPTIVNPETGEVMAQTIPGVEILPAEERWYWEGS